MKAKVLDWWMALCVVVLAIFTIQEGLEACQHYTVGVLSAYAVLHLWRRLPRNLSK